MTLTNEEGELDEVHCDADGDRDKILPRYDPSSFHLSDMLNGGRKSKGKERSSEKQKPNSYGSFGQPQDGSTIVFCEVSVRIKEKTILKRVSGMAKAGEILAIMGPSGAGKSTLLSAMAGRNPVTSGYLTLNGQPVTKSTRREISYVIQSDIFHPILTLREMLTYLSLIRLPDAMSVKQKTHRMLEIVDILELTNSLDTMMGSGSNLMQSGLSGGERKRASIACELITNPKLLLIDEPTSGLDSAIAHDLMSSLAKLSTQQRKTIVTTIHQPSSQIFSMFSNVMLLVAGEVAYFGSGEKMAGFFSGIGLHFDPLINSADFVMEQIKSDKEKLQKIMSLSYAARTEDDWPRELRESNAYLPSGGTSKKDLVTGNDVTAEAKWPTGFWTQYTTLTRRCFAMSKTRFTSVLNVVHVVNILIVILDWFQLPRTEKTMNDRLGLLFFLSIITQLQWCFSSQCMVYDAWGVFENERSAGIYRLSAYYLGTFTAEAPFLLTLGVFYCVICYWMTGLAQSASCFFLFLLLILFGMLTAQSLGIMLGVVIYRRDFAASITTSVLIVLIISAGFYNASTPVWIDWIRYVSFFARVWASLIEIEWTYGDDFLCDPADVTRFPQYCTNGTTFPGSAYLSTRELTDISIYASVAIAFSNFIVFHVAAYLFLRFMKPKPRS